MCVHIHTHITSYNISPNMSRCDQSCCRLTHFGIRLISCGPLVTDHDLDFPPQLGCSLVNNTQSQSIERMELVEPLIFWLVVEPTL